MFASMTPLPFSSIDIVELFALGNDEYIIANLTQDRFVTSSEPTNTPANIPDSQKNYLIKGLEVEDTRLKQTKAAAQKATTLEQLALAAASSAQFNLENVANNLCFFTAHEQAAGCDIVILGDYPNIHEDKTGHVFTGGNSQLLYKMLIAADLQAAKIVKANLVFWRPLGGASPSTLQIELCLPFVRQLIYLLRPKILLILGNIAFETLVDKAEYYKLDENNAAQVISSYGVKNIPTITPNMAKHLWHAVLKIKTLLQAQVTT